MGLFDSVQKYFRGEPTVNKRSGMSSAELIQMIKQEKDLNEGTIAIITAEFINEFYEFAKPDGSAESILKLANTLTSSLEVVKFPDRGTYLIQLAAGHFYHELHLAMVGGDRKGLMTLFNWFGPQWTWMISTYVKPVGKFIK